VHPVEASEETRPPGQMADRRPRKQSPPQHRRLLTGSTRISARNTSLEGSTTHQHSKQPHLSRSRKSRLPTRHFLPPRNRIPWQDRRPSTQPARVELERQGTGQAVDQSPDLDPPTGNTTEPAEDLLATGIPVALQKQVRTARGRLWDCQQCQAVARKRS